MTDRGFSRAFSPMQELTEMSASRANTVSTPTPVPLVFDTSILTALRLEEPSPDLKLLRQLSEANMVRLVVPNVAAREWLSRRIEAGLAAVEGLKTAVDIARRYPPLMKVEAIAALVSLRENGDAVIAEWKAEVTTYCETRLADFGFVVTQWSDIASRAVMDAYFLGRPPFRAIKSRDDIPDGFIYAEVLATHEGDSRTIFVCADKRLRHFATQGGVVAVDSLTALLKTLKSLHANAIFALWWSKHFREVVALAQSHETLLLKRLAVDIEAAVDGITVRSNRIPSDDHEATIDSCGYVETIVVEWANAESLGEGVLAVPVTFQALIELDFSMYALDMGSAASWVRFRSSEMVGRHYVAAHGEIEGAFAATLVVGVDERVMIGELRIEDVDLSIEDAELTDIL
ncbi:MAG: DUF4935 domain-containing protein [Clostridia bacterium]|nr:DUF4935 domain-containing protein [Deltaproteobacteria bacterium]